MPRDIPHQGVYRLESSRTVLFQALDDNPVEITPDGGDEPGGIGVPIRSGGGASITTPKSILMGYGFEAISSVDQRNAVMSRIADYLLR